MYTSNLTMYIILATIVADSQKGCKMTISPTDFRKDLFKLLDMTLETGKVLEINRNGHIIKVVPPRKVKKLDRLVPHKDAVVGDSDDFVSMDWSGEWKPSI